MQLNFTAYILVHIPEPFSSSPPRQDNNTAAYNTDNCILIYAVYFDTIHD